MHTQPEARMGSHHLRGPVAVVAKLRDGALAEDLADVGDTARFLRQQPIHRAVPVLLIHPRGHVARVVAPVRQDEVVIRMVADLVILQGLDDITAPAGMDEARLLAHEAEGRGHLMLRVQLREGEERVVRGGINIVLGVEAEDQLHGGLHSARP